MRAVPLAIERRTPQVLKEEKTKRYSMARTTIEMPIAEFEAT